MDKIKDQLAFALKYGFWIACGIVFVGSLAVWFMTTKKLADEAAAQTAAIEGAIATVSSTKMELPTLPNEYSHTEMRRLIEERQEEVLRSWSMLYDRQRSILTWPVDELKQDFVDEFKDLIPIEIYVDHPTLPEDEKETTLLRRYEDYIKNVLPDIAEIGGCEWTAEFNQSAEAGGMMGMMEEMGGFGGSGRTTTSVDITGAAEGPLVTWGSSSQGQVLTDMFPWRGKTPTTLEVYYSQENIWILRQLMKIVANVNGDATQPYQAKIREIHRISIGDSVDFEAGQITDPGTRPTGMGMGMGMGMEMDMEMDMEFEMDYDSGSSSTMVSADPADNRYVDVSLKPIAAASLRSALTSNSPNDAALAVAKRVPVMMAFDMDQRAVPELVAACGSAALMVDVIQVRVLPKGASGGGGGMMGDMGDEMGGMEMEMEMMGGMGGMGDMGGMAAPTEPVDEYPLDMSVEIYGIIHIYNPPARDKLGVDQVTEETSIDGTETIGQQKQPGRTVEGELPTPQADPADADPNATTPEAAPGTPATPAAATPPTAMVPPVSQP